MVNIFNGLLVKYVYVFEIKVIIENYFFSIKFISSFDLDEKTEMVWLVQERDAKENVVQHLILIIKNYVSSVSNLYINVSYKCRSI